MFWSCLLLTVLVWTTKWYDKGKEQNYFEKVSNKNKLLNIPYKIGSIIFFFNTVGAAERIIMK